MFVPRTVAGLLTVLALAAAQQPVNLGRSPVDNVTAIAAGRFVTTDLDDILLAQDLGRIQLSAGPGSSRPAVRLCRLSLVRLTGTKLATAWQSSPLLAEPVPAARVAANPWAIADINADGLSELLLPGPDSCRIVSFGPDSVRDRVVPMSGAWPTDVVACDLTEALPPEIATLELSPVAGASGLLLRVYRFADSTFVPVTGYISGLDWGADTKVSFTGTCRLPDYYTEMPVIAATPAELKPGTYAVLQPTGPDSFCLASNPFPTADWFSKDRVLPSGRLSLFNVGDTLVAWGYFVPGSRPSGPATSFAALEDGEWRLLSLAEPALRLSGPVCRFRRDQTEGWLEYRDNCLWFYPGDIFQLH